MFLSVEWAKRWFPAVFLLLSLFLPWWTMVWTFVGTPVGADRTRVTIEFTLSFPWADSVGMSPVYRGPHGHNYIEIIFNLRAEIWHIPHLFFVSALIVVGGLCGLSDKSKIRTLGGTLGIAGIISYFILVLHKSTGYFRGHYTYGGNPYFGYFFEKGGYFGFIGECENTNVWFLSVGFYLALAGSLMLLLPLIRTLIERLRKRL